MNQRNLRAWNVKRMDEDRRHDSSGKKDVIRSLGRLETRLRTGLAIETTEVWRRYRWVHRTMRKKPYNQPTRVALCRNQRNSSVIVGCRSIPVVQETDRAGRMEKAPRGTGACSRATHRLHADNLGHAAICA